MANEEKYRPTFSVSEPGYWEDLYRRDDTGWDLGTATPVFREMKHLIPGAGKMLVLGSGKGHDAIFFAQHGYETVGVDFAATAVKIAHQNALRAGTKAQFLQEDLFLLPLRFGGHFDVVVEYVTYCAIDPVRRGEYHRVVTSVLKPGGVFFALFFPIDARPGGPPYSVDVDEVRTVFSKTFVLLHESRPASSVKPRLGKELLMVWKKT